MRNVVKIAEIYYYTYCINFCSKYFYSLYQLILIFSFTKKIMASRTLAAFAALLVIVGLASASLTMDLESLEEEV